MRNRQRHKCHTCALCPAHSTRTAPPSLCPASPGAIESSPGSVERDSKTRGQAVSASRHAGASSSRCGAHRTRTFLISSIFLNESFRIFSDSPFFSSYTLVPATSLIKANRWASVICVMAVTCTHPHTLHTGAQKPSSSCIAREGEGKRGSNARARSLHLSLLHNVIRVGLGEPRSFKHV